MARASNILVGMVNIITLIISIPIVGMGLWLKTNGGTSSYASLQLPILVLGLFIMLVSFLGIFGSCCRVSFFMWLYLLVAVVLIVGLSCFIASGFVLTRQGGGEAVAGRAYDEYTLGGYSPWLEGMLKKDEVWSTVRDAMRTSKVCSRHGEDYVTAAEFYETKLTAIQSGCCKPPTSCGFKYKNATYWTTQKSGLASDSDDCETWSNDQERLCFACESCKAGVLQTIKEDWRMVSIYLGGILVFLVIILLMGCCALRNNRGDRYKHYRGAYR